MSNSSIQCILRILAVAAIFIGVVMLSNAIVTMLGFSSAVSEMQGNLNVQFSATGSFGLMGMLLAAMPAIWGAVLFRFSPRIADLIHG